MGHDIEAGGSSTGRALVVYPLLKLPTSERAIRAPEGRLAEAVGLAEAIQLNVVHAEVIKLNQPRPATLIGKGGVEKLAELIEELEIGVVIVDAAVSPVQQRNLETAWQCKVIDRTGLILEIFGARARTHEGPAAGRTGGAHLSALALGAVLDPSGTPARRLRFPGRPGRKPARTRSPPDRRPHHQAEARAGRREAHAQPASPGAAQGAVPDRGAGGIYQRRANRPCSTA